MSKLLSIIVPIYNAENTAYRCIESLVSQTYDNLEIILIDDGSSDGSRKICEEFADKDTRIKYYYQQNGGPAKARNTGLLLSKGDYIAFVDADDFSEPSMYKEMIANLEAYNADMVVCAWKIIDETENINYVQTPLQTEALDGNAVKRIIFFEHLNAGGGYPWNKVIKRECLKNVLFSEELKLFEDKYFVMQALDNVKKVIFLDLPLYNYIITENSISHKKGLQNQVNTLFAYKKMLERFESEPDYKAFEIYYKTLIINTMWLCKKENNEFVESEFKSISDLSGIDAKRRLKYCILKKFFK